jgi:glycosyltransferase involved in cell wall biosynthesis
MRLLFFLLFNDFDVVHANDLDTLLPNYLASKIKRKHIVYDTHEYFTEVPELQNNPIKKKIWKLVEQFIFPKLQFVFTVNESIADVYKNLYGIDVWVMRNVPNKMVAPNNLEAQLPIELQTKPYIILQGAGINIDRGAEELVQAMQHVTDANLLIMGDGDVVPQLMNYVLENKLQSKVFFMPKQPYHKLLQFTSKAAIGATLDKNTNLNYQLSLPNKLFDYVRAEIPILASNLVETKKIFDENNIGCLIENHNPKSIAETINFMLSSKAPINDWKRNLKELSGKTNWETECQKLIDIYSNF